MREIDLTVFEPGRFDREPTPAAGLDLAIPEEDILEDYKFPRFRMGYRGKGDILDNQVSMHRHHVKEPGAEKSPQQRGVGDSGGEWGYIV